MLKDIIYYSILLTLITLLVTPFILQWILKKALKKLDFNIRFAGLFSYRDIRLRVNQGSSVFQTLRLSIDSITLKKMPKKFALVICMRKPVIQLGIRALDLFITGNTSNLQRLATNNAEEEHIAKNSVEILNLIRDIYAAQTKVAPKTKKAKDPEMKQKKKSLNDNNVFFKKMFGRLFVMTVMKLLVIEVTDCEFEIAQVGGKLKEPKPMFKLEIGKYNGYFEYQKTDSFLMNNQLRDGFMYLRNDKEHKLDLITSIEAINLKLDLPLAFRIKNSILKSKMETNLDTLEVNIKDEHLQAFIVLFGNFDLAKGIISLCLKQIRKLSQPEQFESEVNLMKKNLRIKKTLVPVMPSQITVAVNTLKITLPLKLSNKSQDVLYDEEILKANLKNFVVTVQMTKQEEANHPSKFTLCVGLATERLTLNINSMMNELVSIQNMELELETYIQKVKGEALHHKGFRNRISFNQTSFELHYCFFPLVKKVLQIEQIQLTYKMKNYKPLIKYIFKNRNQFLQLNNDPQKQIAEDQKMFSGNFMETIFQATSKEEDLSDTKILSQEFALDVKDLHLRVSDVQKSFVVDLTAKDLVYKNFRQEDGTNFDDVSCGRILLESQQEFGFPLLASQEFALHLVGEYMDEKEARNSIDLVDVSVRLNDFIVLKLISIFDEYAAFFKKVGFIEPPKKKKGWTSLKTMISKKLTELLEIRNYKSKIKEAQMHVQLRKISAQYDYLEKYAMRLQVDEVQKHSEKISSILNYPTITNFSMDFLKLDQGENQVPMRVFDLSAVTINKEFLRRADGKLDFANYTFKVSLLRPTIIVPNAFVELGAFIKLLALSIITITNHIKKDRPVQPPKKDDLTKFNSLSCDIAFTIRNFKFTLEDSWRNYSLTKFQHLIRNHLSRDLKKDSYELMTNIANLSEIPNSLLSLDIGTACFVLGKYDNQGLTVEDLISKIKTLDKNKFKLKPQYFSSIKALALSFTLTDVSISMRDYVTKILNLKKLDFGGYIINCLMNEEFFIKDSATLKKTFYSLGLTLSSIEIGYGLCYSPATNEIVEWIKKCLAVMKTVRRESQAQGDTVLNNTTNDSIIQPPSKNSINTTNSWDTWRYQTHGIFEINVPHKVKLIFVTSLFPYTPESLLITLENFHLVYHKFLQMTCERVMIKRNPRPAEEGHLVNIPKVELIVRLDWKCSADPFLHYTNFIDHERDVILNPFEDFKSKNLEISIFLNVPYGKDANTAEVKKAKFVNDKGRMSRFMAKNSGSPFFYFQTEFVDWIMNLPSLRYDMLRLYRINVNKYSEESEQDADGNPKAEGIYSDYMELIKHTLNAQLNAGDEDQNVLMQISKINFKVHVGATRVIYSNLKAPLKVEIPNEVGKGENVGSGEEKHILGLQGVIDNMTISCCFYQKQNTLNPATLRKLTKKKRKYNLQRKVWKIKETLGKLNLLYLSTFDGLELLELKPKEFASNRRNSQHITLDNLQAFREFFNINNTFFMDEMDKKGDAVGQSLINNLSSPVLQPTKLIRASSLEDPLATPMAAIKNIRARHFNFEEHVNLSRNDSSSSNLHEQHSPPLQEIIEEEDPVNVTKLQDFEYSGLGIFFKADLLIYEQDKPGIVEDDEMIMSDKDMIENFFTISGSKLLVTFHLKDIVNHFISAHKTTKHTLKIRSRLPKKKASSKGDDSTVQAVPSLLVDDEWILKNLHNNFFKSAKKEITKKIKFVINIEKPQFNLQYMSKDSQMLLASRKNCMITFYQFQLPFDTFGQDLKYLYKICFNKLECFVAPMNIDLQNKNAFWLEEDQLRVKYFRGKEEDMEGQYEPREGLLLRIISCNKVFFNYTQFKLDKCEIDFSKEVDMLNPIDEDEETHVKRMKTAEFDAQRAEHMKKMIIQQNQAEFWKDEQRINGLSIKADELISYSDSSGFRVFRNVMEFIVLMISSSKIKMKALEIQKGMLNELKHVGKKVFSERIKEKISEREKIMSKRKSNIEYSIRKGSLYLTKDESPFINVSLNDMKGLHMIYDDESTDYILEVKALEIVNLNESQSEYKMILTKLQSENPNNQNENLMFYMRTHYYYVPGVLNTSHKWKVYENFEFKFSPIMIKLTEDIYHRIYEFVFEERFDAKKFKDKELLLFPKLRESLKKRDSSPIVDKKEANDSGQLDNEEKKTKEEIEIDKEAKRLPSFYRYARIGDLKVEFSFKSSSFIKRLNHVKVLMSAFTKYSKFWTTKKLFDSFEKHVIRQSVSQAFSILSQKMGISNKEIQLNEESADKELERKKKMLLGTK